MTHTISHRQGGVTRGKVGGLLRHNFRDVDRMMGRETNHSNPRIDPMRTIFNESVMYRDGEALPISSSAQVIEELDRRLETVHGTRTNRKTGETKKTALRKDAGVIREVVMTLDPKYSRSSHYMVEDQEGGDGKHAEKVKGHFQDMIDFYADVYGRENLLASSLHLDETTPHVHLWLTPIAEVDGIRTIKQSAFIKDGRGPKSGMGRNDRAMREWMRDRGYDADPEPRRVTTKNMSAEEQQKVEEWIEELRGREVEVEDRNTELTQREAHLEQREAGLQEADKQVSEQAGYVSTTMAKIDEGKRWLRRNYQHVKQREKQVEQEEAELPNLKARAVEEGRKEGFDQGVEQGRSEIEKAMEREVSRQAVKVQAGLRRRRLEVEEEIDASVNKQVTPEKLKEAGLDWMRSVFEKSPDLKTHFVRFNQARASRSVSKEHPPHDFIKADRLHPKLQGYIDKKQQHGRDRDDGFQPGM